MFKRSPYSNPTPRRYKFYRATLTQLQLPSFQPNAVNLNANTWKWLYSFFYSMYYRRIQNLRFRVPEGTAPPSLNAWLAAYTARHFPGLTLLSISHGGTKVLLPKQCVKAFYNDSGSLQYTSVERFMYFRETGEILWCQYKNNWYTRGCFYDYFSWNRKHNRRETLHEALPAVFTCPLCRNYWGTSSKVRNTTMGIECCPECKDRHFHNKPQTPATIFGEYHSHGRNGWQFFPCTAPKDDTIPMGVELEVCFKHYRKQVFNQQGLAWELYQKQLEHHPKWNLFYFERDGSLGEPGIEMITQPMSQKLHNEFWPVMLPHIRENFTGWDTEVHAGSNPYGIHITFEVARYGAFHVARLIRFIENTKNQVFVQGMAQRGQLYGANGKIADKDKKLNEVVAMQKGAMIGSLVRNQAIHVKTGGVLCEVRMFRSTLNTTSFFKNLEFLYAFREWCSNTSFNISHESFVLWLCQNAKTLYYKYPHLYQFLALETFPVKLAVWSVANPWRSPFGRIVSQYKPGQRDFFVPTTQPDLVDYT